MGSVGDAYDNAMCESFFATLECELLDRCRFKTQAEARNATFAFIEGFYNLRRRHSSIGYLSPINYERRHHALAVDPDAHQPAVVLATVKDKPSGRPQDAAVLDRRCARRPHHRAGRDGRMAPPGAEPKNVSKAGGQHAVRSDSTDPKLSPLHETGASPCQTSAFKGTSIASVAAPSIGLVPSLGLPNTMTVRGFSVSPYLLAAAAWSISMKTIQPLASLAFTARSNRSIVS